MTDQPDEKPTRIIWLGDSIWKDSKHQVSRPENLGKQIADLVAGINPSLDMVEIKYIAVEVDDGAEEL